MKAADLERATLNRVAWRIVPFICLLYVMNILDRVNVGFARKDMEADLGMNPSAFDIGYGMFYVGYLLFEFPSNLLLRRVGARRWIARIMISWGVVSCATMLVQGTYSFYAMRVLLGIAEAGFFPGIVLYLTYWFPDSQRARMSAFFMLAIALSSMFGAAISGVILQYMDHVAGLAGWRWLFLLEGIPTVVLGFCVFGYLTDYPRDAKWLADDQRQWLVTRLQQEDDERRRRHRSDHLSSLLSWQVWLLIAIYFTVAVGANAGGAHFPKLIESQFPWANKLQNGLLFAIPHLCAVIVMPLVSVSSDRTGERRWHLAGAALLAASGWCLAAWSPSPLATLAGLCIAQAGMMAMLPVFWTLPARFLTGAAAAGGIAMINSLANIGGIFGPSILGQLGAYWMAGILAAGALLVLGVRTSTSRPENAA